MMELNTDFKGLLQDMTEIEELGRQFSIGAAGTKAKMRSAYYCSMVLNIIMGLFCTGMLIAIIIFIVKPNPVASAALTGRDMYVGRDMSVEFVQ